MKQIILLCVMLLMTAACGKKRPNCADVLCPGNVVFTLQIVDAQGRSLESNSKLSQYYNFLQIKLYQYNTILDSMGAYYDSTGLLQLPLKDVNFYVFEYNNGTTPDTFYIAHAIPLSSNNNYHNCCPDNGFWSVTGKDVNFSNYQSEKIKIKKQL